MLQVEPNRVRLTATLKYKVRGTPAYGVNIQLPNWRVEQIGPDTLVDADALDREKREPLQIPLRAAAVPESGEFTLQLDAIQEIAEGSGAVSITLPRPEAKASTRAVVAVLPADNVELTIADSELQGLEKEPFPPQIELPVRQQTPLFFRERSDVKSAVLGAALRLRDAGGLRGFAHPPPSRGPAAARPAAIGLPGCLRAVAGFGIAHSPRRAGFGNAEDPARGSSPAVQRSHLRRRPRRASAGGGGGGPLRPRPSGPARRPDRSPRRAAAV